VLSGPLFVHLGRGPLGAGMGDQGLAGQEFKLEIVMQELRQASFDLLGFGIRSGEPEQGVVGLCRGREISS
jgi:hypothetical protein